MPWRWSILVFAFGALVLAGCASDPAPVIDTSTGSGAQAPSPEAAATESPSPEAAATESPSPEAAATESPTTAPPTAVPATPEPQTPVPTTVDAQKPFTTTLLQEQFCLVGADSNSVREQPVADANVVGILAEGACRIYVVGDEQSGWLPVVVDRSDGVLRGWMPSTSIEPQRSPIDSEAATVVITISLTYDFDDPSSQPSLNAFRLVDSDGLPVGFLDSDGSIVVAESADPSRFFVEAEFANDPFCAWTGPLRFEGPNTFAALLEAICA